jgi:hypothetical protein
MQIIQDQIAVHKTFKKNNITQVLVCANQTVRTPIL